MRGVGAVRGKHLAAGKYDIVQGGTSSFTGVWRHKNGGNLCSICEIC